MTGKEEPSWTLYRIVERMNGGDIEPLGETNYDKAVFERMERLENLIRDLIEDFMICGAMRAPEASIQDAATEANRFLKEIADWIENNPIGPDLSALNGRLTAVENGLSSAQSDISLIQGDITYLDNAITDVHGDIITLQSRDNDLQTQITAIDARLK